MLEKIKTIFKLVKQAGQDWMADGAMTLASSLAYYTVFSMAPLLIIAIAIAGAIFGEEAARGEIVAQLQGLVGEQGAQFMQTAIENADKPEISGWASLISIGVLLVGASGVFIQLQDALNTIWDVKVKPDAGIINFIRKRLLSFSAVLGIGFLLLVSLLASAMLSGMNKYMSSFLPGADWIWEIINIFVSFGFITLMFALMFRYLPDVHIQWKDVWIGSLITACLFVLGKYVLGLYLGQSSFGSTYGAAGSLVILLAWVYYSAQILFFGAEFTQAYAREYGGKIEPNEHAVRLSDGKSKSKPVHSKYKA